MSAGTAPGGMAAHQLGLAVVGGASLLALVGSLLLAQYRSASTLRENLVAQRAQQAQLHADEVGHVLAAGLEDVRNVAGSSEVEAFFKDRDLGMSREYGLELSLVPIAGRLRATVARQRGGGPLPLERVVLLDEDGAVLADSGPVGLALPAGRLDPVRPASAVLLTEDGRHLLLTQAYWFKGRDVGDLVAWVRPASIRAALPADDDSALRLLDAAGRAYRPLPDLPTPLDGVAGLERVAADGRVAELAGRDGGARLAVRVPIPGCSLSLLQVDREAALLGDLSPKRSALGLGLLAAAVLAAAALAFYSSARTLVLRARLVESLRREEEVSDKHRALEREVAERRRLQAAHARLAQAVDQAAEPIALADPGGVFEYVNPAFERTTGWTAAEIRTVAALDAGSPPAVGASLPAALALGHAWKGEVTARRRDGAPLDLEVALSPVRGPSGETVSHVLVARDVTEERRLREALRSSQRLEAVGTMAGGVAHDFNNLLAVINGYVALARSDLPKDHPSLEDLAQILAATERAAGLTRQLLAFARRQVLAPEVLDLNAVVGGVEKMLRRLIPEGIELVSVPGADLRRIQVDPGQLEQVLVNLVVNARDAMPRGGRITMSTGNVVVGEEEACRYPDAAPGEYVRLSVADEGSGIDPAVLPHIFEPFFTTKAPGKGTGLGLSTVYGFVRQSRGTIAVSSRSGEGTTFELLFPGTQGVPEVAPPAVDGAPTGSARHGETVLVVEDEAQVRDLLHAHLSAEGYTVLDAAHGREALDVAAHHGARIHVLLAEVVMPQLGGPELARRFRDLYPEAIVVFMTGHGGDALAGPGALPPTVTVIQKPGGLKDVPAVIRRLLDQGRAPGGAASRSPP